jgi:hypothetical protein
LWPRTWRILEKIGMKDILIPLLDHYPDMKRRTFFPQLSGLTNENLIHIQV